MKKRLKKKLNKKQHYKYIGRSKRHRFHKWLILDLVKPTDTETDNIDNDITRIDLICQSCGKRKTVYAFNSDMDVVYNCLKNGWCFPIRETFIYFDKEEYDDICYFRTMGQTYNY